MHAINAVTTEKYSKFTYKNVFPSYIDISKKGKTQMFPF